MITNQALLLEFRSTRIEEDGKFESSSSQVIDGLRPMRIMDFSDSFEFEDDLTVNNEIGDNEFVCFVSFDAENAWT